MVLRLEMVVQCFWGVLKFPARKGSLGKEELREYKVSLGGRVTYLLPCLESAEERENGAYY